MAIVPANKNKHGYKTEATHVIRYEVTSHKDTR
jgi:hypothetical protein